MRKVTLAAEDVAKRRGEPVGWRAHSRFRASVQRDPAELARAKHDPIARTEIREMVSGTFDLRLARH